MSLHRLKGDRTNDPVAVGSRDSHHLHADRSAVHGGVVIDASPAPKVGVKASVRAALHHHPRPHSLAGPEVGRFPEPQLDLSAMSIGEVGASPSPRPKLERLDQSHPIWKPVRDVIRHDVGKGPRPDRTRLRHTERTEGHGSGWPWSRREDAVRDRVAGWTRKGVADWTRNGVADARRARRAHYRHRYRCQHQSSPQHHTESCRITRDV